MARKFTVSAEALARHMRNHVPDERRTTLVLAPVKRGAAAIEHDIDEQLKRLGLSPLVITGPWTGARSAEIESRAILERIREAQSMDANRLARLLNLHLRDSRIRPAVARAHMAIERLVIDLTEIGRGIGKPSDQQGERL